MCTFESSNKIYDFRRYQKQTFKVALKFLTLAESICNIYDGYNFYSQTKFVFLLIF